MKAASNNLINVLSFMVIILITSTTLAQQTVKASDIIKDIKKGKKISYKNTTITGVLDLTFMDKKLPELPKKSKWWKNGGSNTVEESIDSELLFVNCIFKNDVLAYIHDEPSGYTFIANFENDVTFKNCQFKGNAMFKYSNFEGDSDFSNSSFKEDSTFKYSKFDNKVNFSNTVFNENAIFKYAEFRDGVSFENAHFEDDLNIKYAEIRGDFNMKGMKVAHEINTKYTDINGKSFSKYLLDKN